MAGREAARPPEEIPVVETEVPSRPNEQFQMAMVDASEYRAWLDRATAAGWEVECQHHAGSSLFMVIKKQVV